MKFIVANAFSINMLDRAGQDISFVPVNVEAVKNLLRNEQWESAIGHADIARIVSGLVDAEVSANRINVTLRQGKTSLIIAQYRGPRLKEGATELPKGAAVEFWQVYHC
jgi:hypothetical protein